MEKNPHNVFVAKYRYSMLYLYVFLFSIEEACIILLNVPGEGDLAKLTMLAETKKATPLIHPIVSEMKQLLFPNLKYSQFPVWERIVLVLKPAFAISVGWSFRFCFFFFAAHSHHSTT